MRALFGLIVVVLLVGGLWLGVSQGDRIYSRLILNKAIHEFSTRQEAKAVDRAIALLERNRDYQPALEEVLGWLVIRHEFERALALADQYATTATLAAQARYSLGLCAYEVGDEEQAARLFESLNGPQHEGEGEFPAKLVATYLNLTRTDFQQARATLEAVNSHFESDFFYHSLLGRASYHLDDIAGATAQLARAVELGDRNPRVRLLLAVCHALGGDRPAMERILDDLRLERTTVHNEALAEIGRWIERIRSRQAHVSAQEYADERERIVHLRLAEATINVRQGHRDEADRILADLERDYPERLGLATQRGLLYESRGEPQQALTFFKREAGHLLLAAYKVVQLDPATTLVSSATLWQDYLPLGARVFDARDLHPSAGRPFDPGWNMYIAGRFSTTFELPSTGRHSLDLIARAQAANGVWPIVIVYLDNERVGELYINSAVWDYFELPVSLTAGSHTLRLLYVNNTLEWGVSGDRNFLLDKLIIRPAPN